MSASPYAIYLEESSIMVSLSTFTQLRGDIRAVFEKDGKVYATKRGVPIDLEDLPQVIKALQMIYERARGSSHHDDGIPDPPSKLDKPQKNKARFTKSKPFKKAKTFSRNDEADQLLEGEDSEWL